MGEQTITADQGRAFRRRHFTADLQQLFHRRHVEHLIGDDPLKLGILGVLSSRSRFASERGRYPNLLKIIE